MNQVLRSFVAKPITGPQKDPTSCVTSCSKTHPIQRPTEPGIPWTLLLLKNPLNTLYCLINDIYGVVLPGCGCAPVRSPRCCTSLFTPQGGAGLQLCAGRLGLTGGWATERRRAVQVESGECSGGLGSSMCFSCLVVFFQKEMKNQNDPLDLIRSSRLDMRPRRSTRRSTCSVKVIGPGIKRCFPSNEPCVFQVLEDTSRHLTSFDPLFPKGST